MLLRSAGTRRLFYVVFDILLADGDRQGDAEGGEGAGAGATDMDEVVRDAVRNSIAPCPPPSEVKAGNLTVCRPSVDGGCLGLGCREDWHVFFFVLA